jgi:hypothetical protein
MAMRSVLAKPKSVFRPLLVATIIPRLTGAFRDIKCRVGGSHSDGGPKKQIKRGANAIVGSRWQFKCPRSSVLRSQSDDSDLHRDYSRGGETLLRLMML